MWWQRASDVRFFDSVMRSFRVLMQYMKISLYNAELTKKTIGFGVVLAMGVSAYAFAQTPPALPPLGALPDVAAASNSSAVPSLPPLPAGAADTKAPITPVPAEVASPMPDFMKAAATQKASASDNTGSDVLPPLADLPMPSPESSDKPFSKSRPIATAADKNKPPPIGELPMLPSLPLAQVEKRPAIPELPKPTALPEVNVNAEPEVVDKTKSWETVLAPSIIPVETSFNYRRQLLPSTIYRTEYEEQNLHLPKAVSRQDYEGLLFTSVINNDVETARALLNAGTNINAVNGNGETPLAAAHQAGAVAAERLLMARGGR
jgi:hypothetical protein